MSLVPKMIHAPHGSTENRCNVFNGQDRIQCRHLAVEGTSRCQMHGGNFYEEQINKKTLRTYQVNQWKDQLDKFHDSDTLKSLREEIAIARMTLQSILRLCETEFDMIIYTTKIALMLDKISNLVVQCNKLEDRLGLVLDKSAILNLAEEIIQIVGGHVSQETQALIAEQIARAVEASGHVAIKAI